ncbi:MAG: OmpA family protein [Streptosporangiales bacterium]|nr:OmpA family protein [Streptosporangiales bacterium]
MSPRGAPAGLAVTGVALALLVGSAAPAAAEPGPPTDQTIGESIRTLNAASVRTLDTTGSVRELAVQQSIVPLETEEESGGKTTVTLNSDVLFEFGSAKLTSAASRRIDKLAGRLGSGGQVTVAGYTDAHGGTGFNLKLSRARANAVKKALAAKASGVRIVAVGFGEADPVEPNESDGKDNPAGRAKNRRVEITFRG